MTGFMRIEAKNTGLSCQTKLSGVGFLDKVHIMSIVLKALDCDTRDKVAQLCALAGAANEAHIFDGEETKIVMPVPHESEEDGEE